MFHSTKFNIENRSGLESQTIESVLDSLRRLGAPDMHPSTHSGGGDAHKRIELAKWLSDWHLIAFLGTTGLVSEVRFRIFTRSEYLIECGQADLTVMMRTASSPNLLEDVKLLDPLIATEGWQTLMTFARESAREHFVYDVLQS